MRCYARAHSAPVEGSLDYLWRLGVRGVGRVREVRLGDWGLGGKVHGAGLRVWSSRASWPQPLHRNEHGLYQGARNCARYLVAIPCGLFCFKFVPMSSHFPAS